MSYNEWKEGYDCGIEEGMSRIAMHIVNHARLDPESIARVQMAVEKFMEGESDE